MDIQIDPELIEFDQIYPGQYMADVSYKGVDFEVCAFWNEGFYQSFGGARVKVQEVCRHSTELEDPKPFFAEQIREKVEEMSAHEKMAFLARCKS